MEEDGHTRRTRSISHAPAHRPIATPPLFAPLAQGLRCREDSQALLAMRAPCLPKALYLKKSVHEQEHAAIGRTRCGSHLHSQRVVALVCSREPTSLHRRRELYTGSITGLAQSRWGVRGGEGEGRKRGRGITGPVRACGPLAADGP
jgi:hypothetical protein